MDPLGAKFSLVSRGSGLGPHMEWRVKDAWAVVRRKQGAVQPALSTPLQLFDPVPRFREIDGCKMR